MNTIGPYPSTAAEKKLLLDDLELAMSIDRALAEMKARDASRPLTFDDLRIGDKVIMRHRQTGKEWRGVVVEGS